MRYFTNKISFVKRLNVSLTKSLNNICSKGCVCLITKYCILQHKLTTAMQYHLKTFRFIKWNLSIKPLTTLVRLHVDCRIKPHAPPFIQTPANLFKFYLCSFTPQARHLRVSLYTRTISSHTMPMNSGYKLLGSPILIDNCTLVVRCQVTDGRPPRPQEILIICRNFISKLYLSPTSPYPQY